MASQASIMFEDETIQCCGCDRTFVFTADQQRRHRDKGYQNKPKRCVNCKNERGGQRRGNGKAPRKASENLSDRELLIELGKSIGALKVYVSQQFGEMRKRLDRIEKDLFENED